MSGLGAGVVGARRTSAAAPGAVRGLDDQAGEQAGDPVAGQRDPPG